MTDPVQRLNYFKYQFLTADDFLAEQAYHRDMRRRHNRVLHTPGIADGLDVVKIAANPTAVLVKAGTAIDGEGRELVLPDDTTVDLSNLAAGADAYVIIQYDEQKTNQVQTAGVTDDTRWTEKPILSTADSGPTGTIQLLLARVLRDANKNVTDVDKSDVWSSGSALRPGEVLSADIRVADGSGSQDPTTGAGIKNAHIQAGAVDGTKISNASVPGSKLVDNSVPGSKVQDGSLPAGKIADNSLPGMKLQDNSTPGTKLQDNSVPATKIPNSSLPGAKLLDNSTPGTKLQDGTLPATKLVDNSVPGTKLQDGSTPGTKLQDNSMPGTKLQDGSLPATKIADTSLPGTKLQDNSLPSTKIPDNSLPGTKLQDNSLTGAKIQDGSITGVELAPRTVGQNNLAADSVSWTQLKGYFQAAQKFVISLQPVVISQMQSATGYAIATMNFGTGTKFGPFPEPAVQTPLSVWADPASIFLDVVAITPDTGVNITGAGITINPATVYYYGGPPPFVQKMVVVTIRVPSSIQITPVTTAPFPTLTVHVGYKVINSM